jgi:hypothetical protein
MGENPWQMLQMSFGVIVNCRVATECLIIQEARYHLLIVHIYVDSGTKRKVSPVFHNADITLLDWKPAPYNWQHKPFAYL